MIETREEYINALSLLVSLGSYHARFPNVEEYVVREVEEYEANLTEEEKQAARQEAARLRCLEVEDV